MNELDKKIANAMHRIESLYFQTDGKCYVSFSGGKDSTVILAIIKMCEDILTIPHNAITAVFSDTGIELGATKDFVRWVKNNWYENVEIIRPEKTFSWIVKNKGKPMKSKIKSQFLSRYQKGNKSENTMLNLLGKNNKPIKSKIANKDLHLLHPDFDIKVSDSCCLILKKKPFEEYNDENEIKGYILGERIAEGGIRATSASKRINEGGKLCTKTKGKYIVKLPIIDWTDEDIEQFINQYNIPLSKAYTKEGYERTGCFLCPFSLQLADNLERLYKYEPNRYRAAMFWLKDVYIAQNAILSFDNQYEKDRKEKWQNEYEQMRYEMLEKYRPEISYKFNNKQITIYEFL
jgi:3'-phosphoadenosine 5'-phosphosulfate sulfotransferase (PAPS reductase)/FAD synthetase